MRKNFKNKKRVLALALACSMAFAEMAAPIPVAFAAEAGTVAAKPGTVTNLRFDTKENGILDTSMLEWDAVQGAESYQIKITDAQGEYTYQPQYIGDGQYSPNYFNTYSTRVYYDLDDLLSKDLYVYVNNEFGYPEAKKDANGKEYKIVNGGTYSIQIRAVNSKIAGDSYNVETAYGEWSTAISYTMPASSKPSLVTNIKIEDGRLTFNRAVEDSYNVAIEIKDAAGRYYYRSAPYYKEDGSIEYNYAKVSSSTALLSTEWPFSSSYTYVPNPNDTTGKSFIRLKENDKDVKPFVVGGTYTIRLAAINNTTGEEVMGDWSAPITYKVADKTAPEATGNLKYNPSNQRVTWNSVPDASLYKIEIKDSNGLYYGDSSEWVDGYQDSEGKWVNGYTNYLPYFSYSSYYTTLYTDPDYARDYKGYRLDAAGNIIKDEDGNIKYEKDAEDNYVYAFKPGSTYTVTVTAYNINAAGVKLFSTPVSVTFTVPTIQVDKVKNVYVANGTMKWDSVDNVSYYQCEIKDASGKTYYSDAPEREYNQDGTFKEYNWNNSYAKVGYDDDDEGYHAYQYLRSVYAYSYIADKDAAGKVLGYIREVHPSKEEVRAFEPGKSYTVRVRAARYDSEKGEYVYGAWSDAATATIDNNTTPDGINKAPAKVSGFYLETDGEKVSTPTLYWNGIDQVEGYEFEIVDSKGNVYSQTPNYINHKYVVDYKKIDGGRSAINSYSVKNLSGLKSYIIKDGSALDTVKNTSGVDAATFEAGETYKIRIRAYNTYRVWDVNRQDWSSVDYFYGPWSATVTYKVGKASAVTGLKYVKYEDDYYRFTYTATKNFSNIYYQVATDNKFNAASTVIDWTSCGNSSDLLTIYKGSLEYGKTYYIRAVNYPNNAKSIGDLKPAEITALKPAVASFKTIAKATPKNITNLELYNEDSSSYNFRFKAVLDSDNGDYYEMQASTDKKNWGVVNSGGTSVGKSNVNEGTTYIRAIAYVWQYNESTGKSEKVYGKPSNVVTIKRNKATSSAGKLSLKSNTDSSFTFAYSGNVEKDQTLRVEISDSKNFDTNAKYNTKFSTVYPSVNKEFSLDYSSFVPGKTYYVRARVYNGKAKSTAAYYSAYTNVITVKTVMPKISLSTHAATKNSITIAAGGGSYVTGYEFQKQNGTKWVDLAKQAGNAYTDTKLKADTTYTYRVRPYFFDTDTKKITYGEWEYTDGTTWVGTLNPIAKAASKKSVKITWSAVSGAKGYEVYRRVGSYNRTKISNGMSDYSSQWKQIKTLSSKAKSYIDKDVNADMSYTYKIVAYKTIGGKKVIIDEIANADLSYVNVDLSFRMTGLRAVQKSNGKVTWSWNPVYSAKGYLVEKLDNATGKWSTYKNIKKASTSSITLPKTNDAKGVTYRVRAYNGKKYTGIYDAQCTVYPVVAAPTGVKAKANAKNGTITVTWKKVSGADYYRVYRTTDSRFVYNADMKAYGSYNAGEVTLYVADNTKAIGYRAITEADDLKEYYKKGALKFVDREISKTVDGVKDIDVYGPRTGVTYYYYVVAYKNGTAYQYVNGYDGTTKSLYSNQVSATVKATAPTATPKLSSVKAAKGKVTVAYKKIKGVDGYEIYRSTNSKKGFEVVGTVGKETTLKYVDKNSKKNVIKKGKTYYYKIRGFVYDDAGNKVYGKFSAAKKVKAK